MKPFYGDLAPLIGIVRALNIALFQSMLAKTGCNATKNPCHTSTTHQLTMRGCLGNSNDQDSGVVLKLAAAEIGDAVQQATVKRLGR